MDYKSNSLNIFRLIAAFQVMYGHFVYFFNVNIPDIISKAIGVYQGVPVFFGLSGFLIYFSIENSADIKDYYKKRFLRIYPEMWVAVIINVIFILCMNPQCGKKDLLSYFIAQSTIFQFWCPQSLVMYRNGTLWTICIIVQFYIVSWLVFGLLRRTKLICDILLFGATLALGAIFLVVNNRMRLIDSSIFLQSMLILHLWTFIFGMLLAKYFKEVIVYLKKYWLLFLMIAVSSKLLGLDFAVGCSVVYTCAILCSVVGCAYSIGRINITDISYEIYLFHMLIANAMIIFGYVEKIWYFLVAILLSLVIAYIVVRIRLLLINSHKLV